MTGIYAIISPSNRIYIGQAVDIKRRFRDYIKGYKVKRQRRLYNSFNKYGAENHEFHIIEECLTEDLNSRERTWQEFFNVLSNKGLNCLYQKGDGKSGRMSEETKRRVSDGLKGNIPWNKGITMSDEVKQRMSLERKGSIPWNKNKSTGQIPWNKGVPMSEEQKRKVSESKKGTKPWNKGLKLSFPSAKVKKIINIETQEVFNSIKDAAIKCGIKRTTLNAMLSGQSKNKTNLRYYTDNN